MVCLSQLFETAVPEVSELQFVQAEEIARVDTAVRLDDILDDTLSEQSALIRRNAIDHASEILKQVDAQDTAFHGIFKPAGKELFVEALKIFRLHSQRIIRVPECRQAGDQLDVFKALLFIEGIQRRRVG